EGPVAAGVDDDVVRPGAREVVAGVVDDLLRPEPADELDLAGAADAGDAGPEMAGELDGERADATAGADHHDPLPGPHLAPVAHGLEGGDPGDPERCGLHEVDRGGQPPQARRLGEAVRGEAAAALADDPVALLQVGTLADGVHGAGDLPAET